MGPTSHCQTCGSECQTIGGNLWCENCKATVFIFYDEWGSDKFFDSDVYNNMKKFIFKAMAANMAEDSRLQQEDLRKREDYSRIMLEDDNLSKQDVFPEALELIMMAYHKGKEI